MEPSTLTHPESEILDAFLSGGLGPLRAAAADPRAQPAFDAFAPPPSDTRRLTASEWLAWASSPAVKDSIAAIRDLVTLSLELRLTQERAAALSVLADVTRTSADPVERRRAASAILRGPWSATGILRAPRATSTGPNPPPTWRGRWIDREAIKTEGAQGSTVLNAVPHLPPIPDATTRPLGHSTTSSPASPGLGFHQELNSPRPTPPTSPAIRGASPPSSPGLGFHQEVKSPRTAPPSSTPNGGFQGGRAPMASAPSTKHARHHNSTLPHLPMNPSLALALAAGAAPDTS